MRAVGSHYLFSYIPTPHQLILQVLNERVFFATYDKLFVIGFTHCYSHSLIATLVTAIDSYKEIVATAVNLYINCSIVIYDYRARTKTMWRNRCEHKYVSLGRDDGATYAQGVTC